MASPALKAAGALLLSAESLAGAFLPLALAQRAGALALASCFGGGVFLAAALLHLLPHCAEQQQALLSGGGGGHHHHHHHDHDHHHHHHHSAPPNYLALVMLGYLLVLAAERVFFEGAHDHGHGHGDGHGHGHGHGHHHHQDHADEKIEEEEEEEQPAATTPVRGRSRSRSRGRATATGARATTPRARRTAAAKTPSKGSAAKTAPARKARKGAAGKIAATPARSSGLTPAGLRSCLVAMLATSVHTLLECAALGLSSDRRGFFSLLTAVAAHKPASALALSSRFLRAGAAPKEAALYTSAFALVAPLGVALGAAAGGPLGGPLAELWLNCLSCGAFLYVGLTEVIAEEMDGSGGWRARWARFGALVAGVVSVAAVGGHEHDHHAH